MKSPKLIKYAFLLVGLLTTIGGVARAEGATITVSPAVSDIVISESDAQKNVMYTITNSYDHPMVVNAELKGIDEQGGRMLPVGDLAEDLRPAVSLSTEQFEVGANSQFFLTLFVRNTADLSPGAHYATLKLTSGTDTDQTIGVRPVLSVGLFIVKDVAIKRSVELKDFRYSHSLFSVGGSALVRLKNTGNTFMTPRASLTVTAGDHVVAKTVFNENSVRVLQGKEYTETTHLTQLSQLWLPTRLKAVFLYRADSTASFERVETNVWYVPPATIIVLLFVLYLGLRYAFGRGYLRKLYAAVILKRFKGKRGTA